MITSTQISGLVGNQMSQFSAMQQQSAQISGQIGMPVPTMQPPAYNYGGNLSDPWGQQSAARMGVGGMSALATAGSTGMAGLGLAGGLGLMGKAGMALDPFSAGIGGFMKGAGGLGGLTAGRVAGGMALGAAAALPAYALQRGVQFVGENLVAGAQQDYGIQQSLVRNATFYNPSSRSGRGFSTAQRDQISDQIRGLAEQDPFTDIGELNRILERAMRGNMMRGATSAREFGKKFKQLTSTLKETAKVLSTSMEGAMEFFDASQRMGFYNKADVLRNAQNAMTMAGGGLTARGIMQTQASGAAMARAQGFTGAQGAILARGAVQNVRDMFTSGALSQEDLGEMSGGLRGEQAYRAVGRQMQQASYRLARAPIGKAVAAALGEVKEGKFTGGIDPALMKQFKAGELTGGDIRQLVAQKLQGAGRDTKLSFLNMRQDITGSFAAAAGPEGWMGVMSMIKAQRPGVSNEAVKLLMRRMTGMGRRQVEYITKLYERMDLMNNQKAQRAADLLRKRAEKEEVARNYTVSGMWRQFTHGVAQYTTMPLQRAGADIGRGIRDAGQGMRDWAFGRRSTARLGTGGQNFLMGVGLGEPDAMQAGREAMGDQGIAAAMRGTTDLSGGFLGNLFGRGAGQRVSRGLGQDIIGGLGASEGEASVRLQRGTGRFWGGVAGGAITLGTLGGLGVMGGAALGGALTGDTVVSQRKLAAASELINEMSDTGGKFFKEHQGAVQGVMEGIRSLTDQQLLQVNETNATSGATAHRRRLSVIAGMLKTSRSGEIRQRFTSAVENVQEKIAMRVHGRAYKDLDDRQKRMVTSLAEGGLIKRAAQKGKGTVKELLATGEDMLSGLADANLMMDSQKLGEIRESTYKNLSQQLASGRTLWESIGAGAAAGTAIMPLAGTITGAVGGLAKYLFGGGVSAREVSGALQDEEQRGQVLQMFEAGQAGQDTRKKMLKQYGKDKDSVMYRILQRAIGMSEEERTKFREGGIKAATLIQHREALNVAAQQLAPAGRELMGLDRGTIAKAGGEDIADLLLGASGEGGMARMMQQAAKGLSPEQYRAISARRLEAAQEIGELGRGGMARMRGAIGGTAAGRQLLAMGYVFSKDMGQKLEKTLDIQSPEKMQARLKSMGFRVEKEHMQRVMTAAKTQDVTELQKVLATKIATPGKKDAVTVLTGIKTSIDDMTKTTKGLLDVMITVQEKKEGGGKPAKDLRKKYNELLDGKKRPTTAT